MAESLREQAARLLIVRLGSNMKPARPAGDYEDNVVRLLETYPIGGVIVFNGAWPDTAETLARLQARSDTGLLVGMDMERGVGQQIRGATLAPHLAAFARSDGPLATVETFAKQSAQEALACGINMAFGPVADVARNADNPIIDTRAFGNSPQEVARLVAAHVHGLNRGGVLSTAKHFPGHGGTASDSHATLPVVEDARETLERTDLLPFRAAIAAGVDLVMTAHVAVPALDPSGMPATRSRAILTDLLRDEMRFRGAVVSDSLHMAGIRESDESEGKVAAACLAAGVDLFCDVRDPEGVIDGIVAAVERGTVTEARLVEAVGRVERLQETLRGRGGDDVFRRKPGPEEAIGAEEHRSLATRVAREAIEVVRGEIPDFGSGEDLAVVVGRPAHRFGDKGPLAFTTELMNRLSRASVHEVRPESSEDEIEATRRSVASADRALAVIVARPAAWHTFGLQNREAEIVRSALGKPSSTLAVLGGERGLRGYDPENAVLAWSHVPVSQVALAERLAPRRVSR